MSMKILQDKWNALSGPQRTNLVRGGVAASLISLIMGSYYISGRSEHKEEHRPTRDEKVHVVNLGDSTFEDDFRASNRKMREDLNNKYDAQIKTNEELQKSINSLKEVVGALKTTDLDSRVPSADTGVSAVEGKFKYPPPPPTNAVRPMTAVLTTGGKPGQGAGQAADAPSYIGDIEHGSSLKISVEKREDSKKKRTIYLPAGFMDAMLLTGLKASTVQNAKDNPEPMMFRVQAPAVLPNEVKANLSGCFVLANGTARLDAERVDPRLVSLHCLGQDGQSVIEEPIKGYVADKSDGTKGLRGIPVMKAGANMVRAFAAGALGGVGEAVRANNMTMSISPLGATSTTTSGGEVAKAGVGEGISEAAGDMRKVFLDLVRQSGPVIEIGPAKECTIILTEGVNLEIRDYEHAGDSRVANRK